MEAANLASREHPCRVIVVVQGDRTAAEPRLDAQLRVGGDAGAGEVVALHLHGELADHASRVVLALLVPAPPPEARRAHGTPTGTSRPPARPHGPPGGAGRPSRSPTRVAASAGSTERGQA